MPGLCKKYFSELAILLTTGFLPLSFLYLYNNELLNSSSFWYSLRGAIQYIVFFIILAGSSVSLFYLRKSRIAPPQSSGEVLFFYILITLALALLLLAIFFIFMMIGYRNFGF